MSTLTVSDNQLVLITQAIEYLTEDKKELLQKETSCDRNSMDMVNITQIVTDINDCNEIMNTINKMNMASIGLGQPQ